MLPEGLNCMERSNALILETAKALSNWVATTNRIAPSIFADEEEWRRLTAFRRLTEVERNMLILYVACGSNYARLARFLMIDKKKARLTIKAIQEKCKSGRF